MDLNELKSLWETENRFQAGGKATRSEEEIRGILRRKSQTHWRAIRRNTLIEMSLILLALLGVGLIVRAQHIFVLPLEWLILWVLAGLGLLFYGVKYWRLGQLPDVDLQLEAFLRIRIRRLRSYMRLYRIVVVGLVPILGALGVLYGFVRESVVYDGVWPSIGWENWLWVLSVMLAYAALAAWGSSIYLKRMYGKHLQKLEDSLREVEE